MKKPVRAPSSQAVSADHSREPELPPSPSVRRPPSPQATSLNTSFAKDKRKEGWGGKLWGGEQKSKVKSMRFVMQI